MTRSVEHDTFVIERRYPAAVSRVFAAWADPAAKATWFGGPGQAHTMDFRVGGREHNSGGPEGGPTYSYDSVYQDIVENERIVHTYDMHLDDQRISVSLAIVEFHADGDGTRLVYTEHGAYLDGLDKPADRAHGTGALLDALGATF